MVPSPFATLTNGPAPISTPAVPVAPGLVPQLTAGLTGVVPARYEEGMSFRRPATWFCLFAIFTAIGIFFSLHYYLNDVTWHRYGTLREHVLEEMTGAYTAMVLVPLLAWIATRFPFRRGAVVRATFVNVAGFLLYTVTHTTLMAITRNAISPLIGLGAYDYGNMRYRYPMEAAGDAVYYAIMVTSIYLLDRFIATRNLETKLAQAQLENLQLQLQPHFLFNTLNAISAVMYEDVEKADRMLAQVSDFMRLVLSEGGAHEIPIAEELRMERMYVDIMKTRLERRLELEVRVAPEAERSAVPFMVLQPLLENSIRHGMGSSRTALQLAIDVERRNGSTVIRVADDGLGFAAESKPGIGLSNVAARLKHLYGDGASFSIGARECGGTLATLRLPFREGGAA
jgi:two-component system LytT family sensor kinase